MLADIEGTPRTPFYYHDEGIMAMIGRNAAIAEVGEHRHELEGVAAYSMWLGVHIGLLNGLRVKVETFVDWVWNSVIVMPINAGGVRTVKQHKVWMPSPCHQNLVAVDSRTVYKDGQAECLGHRTDDPLSKFPSGDSKLERTSVRSGIVSPVNSAVEGDPTSIRPH